MKKILLMAVVLILACAVAHRSFAVSSGVDLVILNAKILTVDKDFSIKQAVAVRGDKIVAVGSTKAIKKYVSKNTKVLDLKGKTLLPGINDSHAHLASWGLERPPLSLDLTFPTVRSIADIAAAIKKRVSQTKPGEWVLGRGWDDGFLEECKQAPGVRLVTRWDVDNVSPENPFFATRFTGHAFLVNSKALELAGITKDTPDPAGGTIVRDPKTGEPTGLLLEKAGDLVEKLIPPWTADQRKQAIIAAMKEMNALGITSDTDPLVMPELVGMYTDVYNQGKFTVRMNLLLQFPVTKGVAQGLEDWEAGFKYVQTRGGFGNEWLRIAGMKIVGGVPSQRTAWMYEPYIGGGVGSLVMRGDTDAEKVRQFTEMILLAHKNRFQVGIHCCGDREIDLAMEVFSRAMKEDPWDARHYLIHTNFPSQKALKLAAENNLGMNVQSSIKWTISDFMQKIVGEKREAYMWPLRAMLDAGVRVTNSSDGPVTYPNWLNGVAGAVLRESKATGKVSGPEQRITVAEAIRTYTINGAWQDHQEAIKGSIEEGKLADFCIIDKDILSIDPHRIRDIKVLMTIVGGRIVYDATNGRLQ